MKTITVRSKTDSIISLNKIGIPIRGRTTATFNIDLPDHENELMGLVRAGLLEIMASAAQPTQSTPPPVVTLTPQSPPEVKVEVKPEVKPEEKKNKGGRPKGAKNKAKNAQAEEETRRVSRAEAKTQEMGSKVTVGTPDGPKTGRMTRSAVNDITESEQTRASLEAMEKLRIEEEDEVDLGDTVVDESKLDASEQMGRKAVVATEGGMNSVNLVNSILPEAKAIREADPFVDRADKELEKKKAEDILIVEPPKDKFEDDENLFIEI